MITMPGQNGQVMFVALISVVIIANFFSFAAQAQSGSRPCGEPGKVCGGIAGIGCCDKNFYCYIAPTNISDAQGWCVPKCAYPPSPCPQISNPSHQAELRPCAESGQVCGGYEGITCCRNLRCCIQPTNITDAQGACFESCPSPPPHK